MNIQNKRYYVVFTGLFLILVGLFIYFLNPSKKVKKESAGLTKSKLVSSKSVKKVKAEKAKGLPVNFVYEVPNFKKTIPHNVGMKRHIEDMDKMQIVCNGKNCKRQVLTGANAKTYKCAKTKKQNVIKGDVLFSKNSLKHLKSNTKIVGDLYIKNINFLNNKVLWHKTFLGKNAQKDATTLFGVIAKILLLTVTAFLLLIVYSTVQSFLLVMALLEFSVVTTSVCR